MSAMKVACLVLGLAALSAAHDHHGAVGGASAVGSMKINSKKFLDKFAYKLMLDSCYGQSIVDDWYKYVDYHMMQCYKEIKESNKNRAPYVADEADATKDGADTPFYNAATTTWLKNKILDKIEFINCTFTKMNCTVTDGVVETASMIKYYQGLNITEGLKADTIQGVVACAKPHQCGEKQPAFGPADADFITKMDYMKCLKTSRINACVRHTFRERKMDFELEGLEGAFDNLSDDEERMTVVEYGYNTFSKAYMLL